jgi:tensin
MDEILFEIDNFFDRFARDSSKFWYKPTLTREEAISLLRNAQPGTFLVRDSTTFASEFKKHHKITIY